VSSRPGGPSFPSRPNRFVNRFATLTDQSAAPPSAELVATTLVITPTFEEADNVEEHVRSVFAALPNASLLIVDDASSDGTADIVERLRAAYPRLSLLRRPSDHGFRQSYRDGFLWAMARGFGRVVMMDADGSHPAEFLPALVGRSADIDFVVGSRYAGGVRVLNWAPGRLLLSMAGNRYARFWTRVPCADLTAGFNCLSVELLRRIDPGRLRYNGYAVQIELKTKAFRAGARMTEVPIVFIERRVGQSKLSGRRVIEGLWCPIRLRLTV
jgi:dolichol-phosphate mannosyltransferase